MKTMIEALAGTADRRWGTVVWAGVGHGAELPLLRQLPATRRLLLEPHPVLHARLAAKAAGGDEHLLPLALWRAAGQADLHLVSNPVKSSLLPVDGLLARLPNLHLAEVAPVATIGLDGLVDQQAIVGDDNLLILDVVGAEAAVLDAAARQSLGAFAAIVVRATAAGDYAGAPTLADTVARLSTLGYVTSPHADDGDAALLVRDPVAWRLQGERVALQELAERLGADLDAQARRGDAAEARAVALAAEAAAQAARIDELEQALARARADGAAQAVELDTQGRLSEQLLVQLADAQGDLQAQAAAAAALQHELELAGREGRERAQLMDAAAATLAQLHDEIAAKDAALAAYDAHGAAQALRLDELESGYAAASAALAALQEAGVQERDAAEALQAQLAERSAAAAALEQRLAEQATQRAGLEEQLIEQAARRQELEAALSARDAALAAQLAEAQAAAQAHAEFAAQAQAVAADRERIAAEYIEVAGAHVARIAALTEARDAAHGRIAALDAAAVAAAQHAAGLDAAAVATAQRLADLEAAAVASAQRIAELEAQAAAAAAAEQAHAAFAAQAQVVRDDRDRIAAEYIEVAQAQVAQIAALTQARDAAHAAIVEHEAAAAAAAERLAALEAGLADAAQRQAEQAAQAAASADHVAALAHQVEELGGRGTFLAEHAADIGRHRDRLFAELGAATQGRDEAEARRELAEIKLAQHAAEVEHLRTQAAEAGRSAALGAKLQMLREADLRDLQQRYEASLAVQERQHGMLLKLGERLSLASRYFHQLADDSGRDDGERADDAAVIVSHVAVAEPVDTPADRAAQASAARAQAAAAVAPKRRTPAKPARRSAKAVAPATRPAPPPAVAKKPAKQVAPTPAKKAAAKPVGKAASKPAPATRVAAKAAPGAARDRRRRG